MEKKLMVSGYDFSETNLTKKMVGRCVKMLKTSETCMKTW
jgi:hypothetical protein